MGPGWRLAQAVYLACVAGASILGHPHRQPSVPRPIATSALALALPLVCAGALRAQSSIAITGATLLDGTGAAPVTDAAVIVRDGRITCAGPRSSCPVPKGARRIDARGTWLIPGLVDAHVHFSQTGWFDGRPDAADLRERYPYAEVVAGLEAHPERFFRAYLCSGVTSVFDVGGYPWTWAMRDRYNDSPTAPRIAAAGPLLATIDHWLNLPGERQFVYMASDSVVRDAVRANAAFKSDGVKIWYVMPPQPPDTARVQALVRTAADEAHRLGLRLLVHATGLWEAKDALRAGADVLVHSVFEQPVDSEFIELARSRKAIYITTLMAGEGYIVAGQGKVDGIFIRSPVRTPPRAHWPRRGRSRGSGGARGGRTPRPFGTSIRKWPRGRPTPSAFTTPGSPSRSAPTPAIPARCTAPPSTASWSC